MENATQANPGCALQADFQYSLFTAIYLVVFVLGLLENGVALYALTCHAIAAPRAQVYLLNLALVDVLFVCVLPFKIHYHLHRNRWVFGDMACRLTGSVYFLNIYLSIAFFTCICLDRYVAVLHPFAYGRVKRGHYAAVAGALWLAAVTVATPLVLGGPLHTTRGNATLCFESFGAASWRGRLLPYNVCALVFGFAVPFAVILVSYPLIARRISRIPCSSARKRKAVGTIYLILLICTTCFLPFHLTHLLHFLMRAGIIRDCLFAGSIYQLHGVTLALVSLNCCLNPVLYYFTLPGGGCPWRLRSRARPTTVYTICGGSGPRPPFVPQSRRGGKPGPKRQRPVPDQVRLLKLPRRFEGL